MNTFFSPFFFSKYATESYLCCVYCYFFKTLHNALLINIYLCFQCCCFLLYAT
nr:MAG TPA: hypothetical protein [Caudoviricetes sp.]